MWQCSVGTCSFDLHLAVSLSTWEFLSPTRSISEKDQSQWSVRKKTRMIQWTQELHYADWLEGSTAMLQSNYYVSQKRFTCWRDRAIDKTACVNRAEKVRCCPCTPCASLWAGTSSSSSGSPHRSQEYWGPERSRDLNSYPDAASRPVPPSYETDERNTSIITKQPKPLKVSVWWSYILEIKQTIWHKKKFKSNVSSIYNIHLCTV